MSGLNHDTLSTTGVAEATGLPRPTARRVLITLEHLGYVVSEDRRYRLTPRVLCQIREFLMEGEKADRGQCSVIRRLHCAKPQVDQYTR